MQSIPNYTWHPHDTTSLFRYDAYTVTFGDYNKDVIEEKMYGYAYAMVDNFLAYQINDVICMSIYEGLRNTTDPDIQGLAEDRIPAARSEGKTLTFLIALLHEKDIGFIPLVEHLKDSIIIRNGKFRIPSGHGIVLAEVTKWSKRADKIADLTSTARAKVGNFAAYADFIRDWALIDLKESIGVEITTTGNSIKLGYNRNNTLETSDLSANQTIMMTNAPELKLPPVGDRTNQTDGITVTAKNGASFYNIKDSAGNWSSDTVLATDTSRTFTVAELNYGVKTRYIAVPTVYQEIQDQTLAVAVVESVSLDMIFQGTSLTTTVTSSNEGIATAVVTRDGNLAVTGVAAGTATMTVTVTNPSGSVSTTFDVTVTSGD